MKKRLLIAIPCFLLAALVANQMAERTQQQLLWGWRPFFLLLSVWAGMLILLSSRYTRAPDNRRYLLLSTLSGVLLSLGFPVSPLTPLIFVGLVPLLIISRGLFRWRGGPARWSMFKYAFNAFLIWNVCTTFWVINTSFLPGIVANVLNAMIMAAVFTLIHQAMCTLKGRLPTVALITIWIAFEYLHLYWEISWPWLNLGHAFAQYPSWVQWYEITGIFGGSLWVLWVNDLVWRAWDAYQVTQRFPRRRVWGIAAMIILPIVAGVVRWATYPLEEGSVKVAVVQPNFEPHYEKFVFNQNDQLERFVRLSESVIDSTTDYLVFPETSFPAVLLNDIERDGRIRRLRQMMAPFPDLKLVMGIESYRTFTEEVDMPAIRLQEGLRDTFWYDVQNSAVQLATGEEIDPYFKSKLVPGAEFFPFRDVLPFIRPLIHMLQGSVAGLTKQDEREVFRSGSTAVAPVICYESVYGAYVGEYVRKGASMIFIVTNDGWWDDTPGHQQHLKFASLRAIEHRRPIARSANTGVSCFINQRGDILQATDYGVEAVITGLVDPGDGYTFYTRWGDMIARISVFLAVLLLALTIVRSRLQRVNP
ncbi:MAG: apolipoprotein N-acyltransferase [Saprospiraceae bacterium]|nr:apolipoprotein N-acyltransferase [Saprospiraceae bacterium]